VSPVRRLVPLAPLLLLCGCFTSGADFRDDAERFIRDSEEMHAEIGVGGFESAQCDGPETKAVGTTFSCTGVDDQGRTWEFAGEIVEGDQYVLTVSRAP
jgi:hypothetical protein